ncbi:MAG: DUF393 domain-containing protein [Pseudomonadota bacterium]
MANAGDIAVPDLDARAAARVFFDGGCPVCRREIGWYQKMRGGDAIEWVDVDASETVPAGLPSDITRDDLLKRFTIVRRDGAVVSGGPGFIALWRGLGPTRFLGRLTDHRIGAFLGERAYRFFLRVRKLWR